MFKLIVKKGMLPTRQIRFCCSELKEFAGTGFITIIGIRKSESTARSKRQEFTIKCEGKKGEKGLFSPILDWSNSDVWNFIRNNNIKYSSLYDKGFKRIGCVFCPMSSVKTKQKQRKLYPKFENAYKKAIFNLIEEKNKYKNLESNVEEIFNWWLSNDSIKNYLANKNQQKIDFIL